MNWPPIPVEEREFRPNPEQLARARALRRFNWWTLYLPLILLALGILAAAGLVIWQTIEGRPAMDQWRLFVSAVADTVIIFATLAVTFACLVLPAAGIGLLVFGRQKRPVKAAQRLLWRLDQAVSRVGTQVEPAVTEVAHRVIKGRAVLAYWEALIKWIKYWITGR